MDTTNQRRISSEERENIFENLRKSVEERKAYERMARERILNDPEIQAALQKLKQKTAQQATSVTNV